ncbi:hypothetical protein ABPS01_03940 [Streptococcus sp. ZJ151]|uniref:hypothetical protein n=1 Tax=Streptococcus jiangjianxini TaxID=3161189 RepID=UPI0032EEA685
MTFNFLTIIQDFIASVQDISSVYYNNVQGTHESSALSALLTLFSPITYIFIPIGIINFEKMSIIQRFLWFVAFMLNCITVVMEGTNLGIIRILLTTIICITIHFSKGNFKISKKQKSLIFISLTLVVVLFNYNVSSRITKLGASTSVAFIDGNNILFKIFPENFKLAIVLITSYLSQGYNGMNIALDYEWKPTFFLGNSMFIIGKLSEFGNEIYQKTYMFRANSVWSATQTWHTAYTWFANDVSFLGVGIIMFGLGFIICQVYKDILETYNVISILIFPLLLIMILFLPMNNTILSNPLTFVPFVFYLFLFLATNYFKLKKREIK